MGREEGGEGGEGEEDGGRKSVLRSRSFPNE